MPLVRRVTLWFLVQYNTVCLLLRARRSLHAAGVGGQHQGRVRHRLRVAQVRPMGGRLQGKAVGGGRCVGDRELILFSLAVPGRCQREANTRNISWGPTAAHVWHWITAEVWHRRVLRMHGNA